MTSPTLTASTYTCNEQCWYAREEECSCSCNGTNHGCLRVAGAEQPKRNSRVKNARYVLAAIGNYSEISGKRYQIERAYYDSTDYTSRQGKGEAALVKRATADQAARWPEVNEAAVAAGIRRPYLLWVREDLAEAAAR